ncbi:MAG: hypothetical protein ACTSUA_08185, partial [Candidatus Heimdallarchaeota archaeon]
VVLSPSGTFGSTDPRIAADELGNVHIIWKDKTNILGSGSDIDIFYTIGHEKLPAPFLQFVDKPTDITYFYLNDPQKILSWTVSDRNVTKPEYVIYHNREMLQSGHWITDEPIIFILEHLELGNYSYHFEARNGWGEEVTDDVLVVISEKPTILGIAARNALIGFGLGVTTTGTTILIAYLLRKRRERK